MVEDETSIENQRAGGRKREVEFVRELVRFGLRSTVGREVGAEHDAARLDRRAHPGDVDPTAGVRPRVEPSADEHVLKARRIGAVRKDDVVECHQACDEPDEGEGSAQRRSAASYAA